MSWNIDIVVLGSIDGMSERSPLWRVWSTTGIGV
jgi:hypothetical protein